jgi:hypothetical protein
MPIASLFPSASFARPSLLGRAAAVLAAAAVSLAAVQAAPQPREGQVARAGEVWEARVDGQSVYSGPLMIDAIQAAMDGLTPDREWKETVHVRHSGVVNASDYQSDLVAAHVPSFTILNFHGNTVHARGGSIVPVRAQNVRQIEVRNLRVTGNPRFGIFLKGSDDVVLANIRLSLGPTEDTPETGGAGIRTEGGDRPWSGHVNRNLVLDNIYVEHTRGHGVELWRTDGLKATSIVTRHTGGCGILLNQTRNAHIQLVDAFRANHGGGYAGFRAANNAGPNIVVDRVVAVECGRGVFTVSGSEGITIHQVEIARSSGHGMLIEDTKDMSVNGGTISDTGAEGVRITSRRLGQGPGDDHHPASNITVQNLRITGSPWGIRETLPRTHGNRILNNDLRGNRECLEIQGEGTVAEGNLCE